MIHSMRDSDIWNEEFDLVVDQEHFEKVWKAVSKLLPKYISSYLKEIAQTNPTLKGEANVSLYFKKLIEGHRKNQDKYMDIFDPDLMEEYQEDVDGFKGTVLSRQCLVIQRTLNSKSEALKEWKIQYKLAPSQKLYDTFFNMISFAEEYNDQMPEDEYENVDTIEDIGLRQMAEDACYLLGVIGTGILSTVLNSINPRLFPGQFKTGMFALYILTDRKPIEMKSDSPEFLMVKDDIRSKTGTIETEHNYYYPYETFALYTLRIYREMDKAISKKYNVKFPDEFRYVLTNNFFDYVVETNRHIIATILGNDDILKYGTPM